MFKDKSSCQKCYTVVFVASSVNI